MSWFDSNWHFRQAFTIPNAGGASTVDLSFEIPVDFAKYWNNSLSNFNDIRITEADGITPIPFQITSASNYNNKAVTIVVNNYAWNGRAWGGNSAATTAGAGVKAYMYFGCDTANLTSGQSQAFVVADHISNAINPTIDLSQPGSARSPIFRVGPQTEGQTNANHLLVKPSGEVTRVWWDLKQAMLYRADSYQHKRLQEEIAYVKCAMYDSNGAVTSMLDAASIRFNDPHMFSHIVKAGTQDGIYLLICTVGTDDGQGGSRVFDLRATIKVKDLVIATT